MDFVEPIRDKKKISQIKNQLDAAKRFRDLLLFVVGINTALRISDLLQLRIGSVADEQGTLQDKFTIREEKRDKRNQVVINDSIHDALEKYLTAYPAITSDPGYFLFFTSNESQHQNRGALRYDQISQSNLGQGVETGEVPQAIKTYKMVSIGQKPSNRGKLWFYIFLQVT